MLFPTLLSSPLPEVCSRATVCVGSTLSPLMMQIGCLVRKLCTVLFGVFLYYNVGKCCYVIMHLIVDYLDTGAHLPYYQLY